MLRSLAAMFVRLARELIATPIPNNAQPRTMKRARLGLEAFEDRTVPAVAFGAPESETFAPPAAPPVGPTLAATATLTTPSTVDPPVEPSAVPNQGEPATSPAGETPVGSTQQPQKPTAADLEAELEAGPAQGIGQAIKDGTLKVDAEFLKNPEKRIGKTPGGEALAFFVEKGYKGSAIAQIGKDKSTVHGVYVKITAAVDSQAYDEIRLFQVFRYVTKDKDGKLIPADPTTTYRRALSDWANKDAPSPGWMIDTTQKEETFYYQGYVTSGPNTATLWDMPSFSEDGFSKAKNIGFEAITIAVGLKRGKPPEYLGALRWGFYIDDNRAITFDPQAPQLLDGPPKEVGDSLAKWNQYWAAAGKFATLEEMFKKPGWNGNIVIDKIAGITIPQLPPEKK